MQVSKLANFLVYNESFKTTRRVFECTKGPKKNHYTKKSTRKIDYKRPTLNGRPTFWKTIISPPNPAVTITNPHAVAWMVLWPWLPPHPGDDMELGEGEVISSSLPDELMAELNDSLGPTLESAWSWWSVSSEWSFLGSGGRGDDDRLL